MSYLNILSLDDDPRFTMLLKARTKDHPLNLETTNTVKDFLHQFQAKTWDCCLVDINLEEGQEAGFVLLRLLREKLKDSTPVIFLSRTNEKKKIAHALECGANDYVTKPLDVDLLLSKINALMKQGDNIDFNLGTQKVPKVFQKGSITTELKPFTIDEDGLTLVGPNCLSKGTMVNLQSPLIKEIFDCDKIRLMVTMNSKIDEKNYSMFLEFSEEDQDLVLKTKEWIISQNSR